MIEAWRYASSTIEHGMTATAGLADYRGGGGSIRTQDWYTLTTLAKDAEAHGNLIQGQPWDTPIPEAAYTQVDIDYEKEFVAVADIAFTDMIEQELVRRQITVEFDEEKTWDEIEEDIQGVGAGYGAVGGAGGVTIERVRFYKPGWAKE
jgi:hypothetical protein